MTTPPGEGAIPALVISAAGVQDDGESNASSGRCWGLGPRNDDEISGRMGPGDLWAGSARPVDARKDVPTEGLLARPRPFRELRHQAASASTGSGHRGIALNAPTHRWRAVGMPSPGRS